MHAPADYVYLTTSALVLNVPAPLPAPRQGDDARRNCCMSVDNRTKVIRCDNVECPEHLTLPITMGSRSGVGQSDSSGGSSAAGWVFVRGQYEPRHYCPTCASQVL